MKFLHPGPMFFPAFAVLALLGAALHSEAANNVQQQPLDPSTATNSHAMLVGALFRDCPDCPEMVVLPPGSFAMGSSNAEAKRDLNTVPDEAIGMARDWALRVQPQHSVTIGKSFALGRYPVTRDEFSIFVHETNYLIQGTCTVFTKYKYIHIPGSGWKNPGFSQTGQDPVVCVSWKDTQAYIAWLNTKVNGRASTVEEGPYRLPSEAEWEYAARAGTRTTRWWGDQVGSGNADCDDCGSRWDYKKTAPVGSFTPNPFGLYDVLGNVWQWTEDCWNKTYAGAPQDGSAWLSGACDRRVGRGGSWGSDSWALSSANRSFFEITGRSNSNGFRLARTFP